MHKKFLRERLAYAFFFLCYTLSACSSQFSQRSDVQQFINHVATKDNLNKKQLVQTFNTVKSDPTVIKIMTKPLESKPWPGYRKVFITPTKIRKGAEFWDEYANTLQRAEKQFGVPSRVMVAILGVETLYGEHQGNFKVLDTLSTLAFDYPPRSRYFKYELEQYLLLTHEQDLGATMIRGSYAGAIGQPQFMPSSYRTYAIDFSGQGKIDLINNPVDAIGSIGNYLQKKGWQRGQPIAMRALVKGNAYQSLPNMTKPTMTLKELAKYGIKPSQPLPPETKAMFMNFWNGEEMEHWLGFENFAVIMRYNSSRLYALAVDQLGVEISKLYHQELAYSEDMKKFYPISKEKTV